MFDQAAGDGRQVGTHHGPKARLTMLYMQSEAVWTWDRARAQVRFRTVPIPRLEAEAPATRLTARPATSTLRGGADILHSLPPLFYRSQ